MASRILGRTSGKSKQAGRIVKGWNTSKPKPTPWIKTFSGIQFHLEKPKFKIEDIAHGLSLLCRFNGQCDQFYSVAEHSLAVSEMMENEGGCPLEGLLHDGTEAYLSDIPAPWKELLPDCQKMEDDLEAKLRNHFRLCSKKSADCHRADKLMVHIEAAYLLRDRGEDWPDTHGVKAEAKLLADQYRPMYLPPAEAEHYFLKRFKELTENTGGNRADGRGLR